MKPQRKEQAGEEEDASSPRPSFFASSKHWFFETKPRFSDGRNSPDPSNVELGVVLRPYEMAGGYHT